MSPLCESYLTYEQLNEMEPFYPLHVYVCDSCFLVQLEEFVSPEKIFDDYTYFSSFSDYWLKHAKNYVQTMTDRFSLDPNNYVVELASNDGYLLQYFKEKGIPVLGIEPASTVAEVAKSKGINTLVKFFGIETANEVKKNYGQADLLLGNNASSLIFPEITTWLNSLIEDSCIYRRC